MNKIIKMYVDNEPIADEKSFKTTYLLIFQAYLKCKYANVPLFTGNYSERTLTKEKGD